LKAATLKLIRNYAELPFTVLIKSNGGTAIEFTALLERHVPLARYFFNLFHIFNNDLKLVITVAKLE
jgi:hypothetical protein